MVKENPEVRKMLEELRKQQPHEPDPAAWKGISLSPSTADVKDWLGILSDVVPVEPPAEPEMPQKVSLPAYPVDQYADDTERTRAWLNGADMSGAEKWERANRPTAHHVITELAHQYKCTYETEIKPIADAFIVTVLIHREVVNGIDTMFKKERAETEGDIPIVEALLCRDLFVESIGKYGIRKANEAYHIHLNSV